MNPEREQRAEGQSSMRRHNTRAVLVALRDAREPRRATDLAAITGLTRPTVVTILGALLESGVVKECGHLALGGRPSPTFAINDSAVPVLGVDVGAHRIAVRLGDLGGRVLGGAETRNAPQGADSVLDVIVDLVRQAAGEADVPLHRIAALCLATPGVVDPELGRVLVARPLEQWAQTDVPARLAERLGIPVLLENDANMAALALRGTQGLPPSFVALQWGRRLGAGVILEGSLFRGAHGGAGEIGGLRPGGAEPSLEQRTSTADFLGPAMSHGEGAEMRPIAEVAEALAPACAMLGVSDVVLSGGATHGGPQLASELERALHARGLEAPACHLSEYGEDTVLVGATACAADEAWLRLLG